MAIAATSVLGKGFLVKALPAVVPAIKVAGGSLFVLGGVSAVFYSLNVEPFKSWRIRREQIHSQPEEKKGNATLSISS